MQITVSQIVVWIVVGAIAGALVGMAVKRSKAGFGRWANLGIGLVGALIGGGLFRVFNVDLGLGALSISLQDIIAAFLGSLIFLGAVRLARSSRGA